MVLVVYWLNTGRYWCNKDCGMYCPDFQLVDIKEPLLLINSSP